MFKISLYITALLFSVVLVLFIGCGITSSDYGVTGHVYDFNSSNAIQGIRIKLYDSNLSDSTISSSNGFYTVDFVYNTAGGCSIRSESMPEADRNQDFYVEITDIDGTNNGQYQSIVTNIGSIYSANAALIEIEFYLITN